MNIRRLQQPDSMVRAEACAWIAQLDKGNPTHADLEALREWMQRSPQHSFELHQLARLSGDLNVLTNLAGSLHEAAHTYYRRNVAESLVAKISMTWVVTASCLALLVVGLVLLQGDSEPPAARWPQMITTAVGEQREVQLPDDSMIALNTDSQLEVTYGENYRDVRLLKGEALFDVTRDPARPFIVDAGIRRVEAVGTAFVVHLERDSLVVAVTEGRVRVVDTGKPLQVPETTMPAQQPLPAPILLETGQRIVIEAGTTLLDNPVVQGAETISMQELQRKLAWRDGLLDFSDTPLVEVIREVSRHTNLKIVVTDPELHTLEFNGLFRIGDTGPLFEVLKSSFSIDAQYIDANTVALTPHNAAQTGIVESPVIH